MRWWHPPDVPENQLMVAALFTYSRGNLVVADRQNHRIQPLTKNGTFLREYADYSRVSGLAIDGYTAESILRGVTKYVAPSSAR